MDVETELSNVAFLLGEPARALMLWSLLDGQARPAGELAFFANVSPQSASLHLAKLVEAEMLKVTAQGRNRYYSIARPEVAHAIESMAALIPSAAENKILPSFAVPELRLARTCYDHLAGKLAVGIADAMQERGLLMPSGGDFVVSDKGAEMFEEIGIDIEEVKKQRRSFAGKCLDWSERRYHLAGSLGAALLGELLNRKWIARVPKGRAVRVTLDGRKNFDRLFGISA
jgi:DNA-binding transcriptional ArsR family regulator